MSVIPFRTRAGISDSRARPGSSTEPAAPVTDLTQFERPPEADNYRHRMTVNMLAFVVTTLLVLAGIWLATTMAALRTRQDCVLIGRVNCAPLDLTVTRH